MKFSEANTKLQKLQKRIGKKVYSFDLLSGHSCPGAKDCLAYSNYDAVSDSYQLIDGPDQQFRCYSASAEQQYTYTYNSRLHNLEAIRSHRSPNSLATALCQALPDDAEVIRIHAAGDFDSKTYWNAWMLVCKRNPDREFYTYTKMNPFWTSSTIPANLSLTASKGGKYDWMIATHNLRQVVVVYSVEDAHRQGLELDGDDFHAYDPTNRDQDFALLIHGMGPAGSEQAKIAASIRKKAKV